MNKTKKILMLFTMMFLVLSGKPVFAAGVGQSTETTNSITVTWPKEADAIAYYIGYGVEYDDATNMLDNKSIKLPATQTSYTINNLSPGTKYYVKVGYSELDYDGTPDDYVWSVGSLDACTAPGKVTNVAQERWWYYIEKVDVKWAPQTAAKFDCVIKNNKGKNIYNKTGLYSNSTGTKVKNTIVYTAQVRAIVEVERPDGSTQTLTGAWSDPAYLFTQPMVKRGSKVSGGKLKISWEKVNGCTGYDVYVSTKEKSGYKKVASVKSSKTSITVKKLKGKKFSAKKNYYVYIVGKKKVKKGTSTSGRHYSYKIKGSSGTVRWTFD